MSSSMIPPATHTVVFVENDASDVKVSLVENMASPVDVISNGIVVKTPTDTQPTPEQVHTACYENGQVGLEYPRPYCWVWRNGIESLDAEGLYAHNMTIYWYDLSAPQDRAVDLTVPHADLPTNFTAADVIAWGVAKGILNPSA